MTTKKKKAGRLAPRPSANVAGGVADEQTQFGIEPGSPAGEQPAPAPQAQDHTAEIPVPDPEYSPIADISVEPAGVADVGGDYLLYQALMVSAQEEGELSREPAEDLQEPAQAEAISPAAIVLPMAGEGVAAIEPEDGVCDGVMPDRPHYNSVLLLESLIDLSPRNHREVIDESKVQAMAVNMREIRYVIHPVTVRQVIEGRYELVVGEMRLRAARLAGIVYIPAVVRQLTDEEVDEWQMAENVHRTDPHIMAEARKVASMVTEKKSVREIALRLGMSTNAVYTRYHLANLIADFERLYRTDILDTKQALGLSTLSHESQQSLFDEVGKGWEARKSCHGSDMPYIISRYRCDLSNALFDKSENDLIPGVRSCQGCRFNLSGDNALTLFDDDRLRNRCGNSACFDDKTWAAFTRNLAAAIREHTITAIVFEGGPSRIMDETLPKIPGASDLKRYDSDDITVLPALVEPSVEQYLANYGEENDAWREPYDLAVAEHENDMGRITEAIARGEIISGLSVVGFAIRPVLFTLSNQEPAGGTTAPQGEGDEQPETATVARMTTSQIRELVVDKVVDVETLKNEINGIQIAQSQAEANDRINMGRDISNGLKDKTQSACKYRKFTPSAADRAGAFIVLYVALSYRNRPYANEYLFGRHVDQMDTETLVKRARRCTPEDMACLVRLFFAFNDQAKNPTQAQFGLLRDIAQGGGVNVKKIETGYAETAASRRKRNAIRIGEIKAVIASQEKPAAKPAAPARKAKAQPSPKGVKKATPKPINGVKPGGRPPKTAVRKSTARAH